MIDVRHGDSRDVIKTLADASVDSCVCDPPYALVSIVKRFVNSNPADVARNVTDKIIDGQGANPYTRAASGFMGKKWDTGEVAFDPAFWADVLRVLKPGGHLIAFGGTRTYHRLAVAIEDAGFEIRDQIGWLYGSGFPKSHDVSKAIDRAAGAERAKVRVDASQVRNPKATGAGRDGMEGATRPWIEAALERGYHEKDSDAPATDAARQWQGWGTALKPAWEPIVLARKPLIGTVAANVLAHGTGAINVDGCRIEAEPWTHPGSNAIGGVYGDYANDAPRQNDKGRWPANVIHDGSEEVLAAFPETAPSTTGVRDPNGSMGYHGGARGLPGVVSGHADSGSAARFFYSAKADADDRLGSKHPTVKPVDLMAYLCRLVTPPGGTVLDPFAGSGTTGMACMREGFRAVLIEREAEYVADIRRRIAHVKGEDAPLFGGAA